MILTRNLSTSTPIITKKMRKHMSFEPPPELNHKRVRSHDSSGQLKGWNKISDIILNEDPESFRRILFQIRPDLVDKLFGRRKVMIHKVSILQAKIKALPRNNSQKCKGTPRK